MVVLLVAFAMDTPLSMKKTLRDIALYTAIPAVIFGVLGRLGDRRFGTSPWLLLGAMFVALHITLFFLLFRFKKLFKNF